jgi:hypothetical protein
MSFLGLEIPAPLSLLPAHALLQVKSGRIRVGVGGSDSDSDPSIRPSFLVSTDGNGARVPAVAIGGTTGRRRRTERRTAGA